MRRIFRFCDPEAKFINRYFIAPEDFNEQTFVDLQIKLIEEASKMALYDVNKVDYKNREKIKWLHIYNRMLELLPKEGFMEVNHEQIYQILPICDKIVSSETVSSEYPQDVLKKIEEYNSTIQDELPF